MHTNKMKALIACLLLAATANTMAAPRERACMILADQAHIYARGFGDKIPEDVMQDMVKQVFDKDGLTRYLEDLKNIVRYVYLMELAPTDARKIVFLRCMAEMYPSAVVTDIIPSRYGR